MKWPQSICIGAVTYPLKLKQDIEIDGNTVTIAAIIWNYPIHIVVRTKDGICKVVREGLSSDAWRMDLD